MQPLPRRAHDVPTTIYRTRVRDMGGCDDAMVVVTMAMVVVGVRERALCVYARLPGLRSGRGNDVSRTTSMAKWEGGKSSPCPVRDVVNIDPPSLNTPRYSLPQTAVKSTGEP